MRWLAVVTLTAALAGCESPVSSPNPSLASAVLSITFAADGSTSEMTLRKVAGCNAAGNPPCPRGEGTLQTTEWTLLDSELILPPPVEQ